MRTADATLDAAGAPERRRVTALLDTSGLVPGAYLLTLEAGTGKPGSAVRHAIPVRLDAGHAIPSAGVLRHSVVVHGPTSTHPEPGTFVIRDEATWREFWSHLPTRQAAPDIDFSRATLFAIVGPGGREQGLRPLVVSITEDQGVAIVRWRTTPEPSAMPSQAFTVVAVPLLITDVRFEAALAVP